MPESGQPLIWETEEAPSRQEWNAGFYRVEKEKQKNSGKKKKPINIR